MSSPSNEGVLHVQFCAKHPRVLIVSIDRGPVNALSLAMFARVRDFFTNVAQTHPQARCIVLTGTGRFFCAGADVKELSERTTEGQMARSVVSRGCFNAIRTCPIPVLCAVNGAAIGAGVVLASCCDLVVAADTASFSLPEVLVGVMGGARHLARLVPDKVVRYMALSGRKVDARTMELHGGIHALTPVEDLMPAAIELASDIAKNSPSAVQLMKEAINLTEDMPLNEGYRVEQLFTTLASSMPDSKEAALAFLEKRQPVWAADRC